MEEIKKEMISDLEGVKTTDELNELKVKYLGKKGLITSLYSKMKELNPEEKKEYGKGVNDLKVLFEEKFKEKDDELISLKSVVDEEFDLTIPGKKVESGALHPITRMCYDLNDAFLSLGFEVYSEDDISSEKFAFDNLNFPPDHPARQMMDTYWIKGTENKSENERLCLRPHLTGGSVRYLLKNGAPCRFVYPGRVYRNEDVDSGHERAFYQYEALIVDKDISFSSGIVMIKTILEKVFGKEVNVRMREGFFPFTEPGYEIDMQCLVCNGKGCSVCKHNGWLEIMPGGVIHPNVLKAAGLDPEVYTGFYINIGLERLVMMRYGVDDIRQFHSGDLRFLKEFK